MKKFLKIYGAIIIGIVIITMGFIYDVLFAGIPYQDPTPELQNHWDFHRFIASIFYKFGLGIFLAGLFYRIFMVFKFPSKSGKSN